MPELENVNCLACNEPGVEIVEGIEHYTAPFGRAVPYKNKFSDCKVCGVQIDLSDEDAFPNAIRESEKTSVEEILKFFDEYGVSQAALEGQLELPSNCLSHWKSDGKSSRSMLALMRILRAYPWIIGVANSHFHEEIMREQLLQAARVLGDHE